MKTKGMELTRCTCGNETLPAHLVSYVNEDGVVDGCYASYNGVYWDYGCAYDLLEGGEIKRFVTELVCVSQYRFNQHLV